MPDGGLITTAADLARFIDAFNRGTLVTETARRAMLMPYGKIRDGAEAYGYGMEFFVADGETTIFGHAGGDPGVSAMVSHYVADATTVVGLCNHDRGSWAAAQHVAAAGDPRV